MSFENVGAIEIKPHTMNLLDHGYVKVIGTWGSDEQIIEAARMSTDKGFEGWGEWRCKKCGLDRTINENTTNESCMTPNAHDWEFRPKDEKLLRYLYEHKHFTPFEMAGLTIEVQAPIFVFREWHRHRTQSYNEMSARYTELPELCYIPSVERLQNGRQSTKNKQGSEAAPFTKHQIFAIQESMHLSYHDAYRQYKELLKMGVAREIARMVIPVSQYSRMRASANLRNWLAFLTLRMDTTAQWEIREYAWAVSAFINNMFPRTFQLFAEAREARETKPAQPDHYSMVMLNNSVKKLLG